MRTWMVILGLAIAGGCSESVVGTETGNPPVVVPSRITVEAIDDGNVRIRGQAGAISPGGGEVTITNATSGADPVVVEVAEDGSFSAELEGSPADEYEIVAKNDAGDSPPRTVSRGTDDDWETLHECDDSDPMDPVTVTELRVDGDTLRVGVSHGGGCATHRYGLCYGDAWAESYPIQVGFRVLHDAGGDGCLAALEEELSFDLTPFKRAYAEAYRTQYGAARIGFASCMLDAEEGCDVLYQWGDLTEACGPPIGPACPAFEIPQAPSAWVEYETGCDFSFRAPAGLMEQDVQGIDSCVAEFESDVCTFSAGSGGFSNGLTEFEEDDDYEVGQAAIQGYTAKLITAARPAEPRPYIAGVHFPDPFGAGPDADQTADLVIFCETRQQRDDMLAVLGSVRFD